MYKKTHKIIPSWKWKKDENKNKRAKHKKSCIHSGTKNERIEKQFRLDLTSKLFNKSKVHWFEVSGWLYKIPTNWKSENCGVYLFMVAHKKMS